VELVPKSKSRTQEPVLAVSKLIQADTVALVSVLIRLPIGRST